MIKHGKIFPLSSKGRPDTHLSPIKHLITRGVADAKTDIFLQPLACDVRGAKRFNGQQCVIAKVLTRTMHPQGVAVGRSLAYVVVNGLAIRFKLPLASRRLVEEFDQKGRVRNAPVELKKPEPSWRLGNPRNQGDKKGTSSRPAHRRTKRFGVRVAGGGVRLAA